MDCTIYNEVSRLASVLGLNRGVKTMLLCWEPQVGVLRLPLSGERMEVGVRPVLPSIKVSKLRMALDGVSMLTPSIVLGWNDSEAGL